MKNYYENHHDDHSGIIFGKASFIAFFFNLEPTTLRFICYRLLKGGCSRVGGVPGEP